VIVVKSLQAYHRDLECERWGLSGRRISAGKQEGDWGMVAAM
jgi:hypothetical protein